jgi:hypothetical protein
MARSPLCPLCGKDLTTFIPTIRIIQALVRGPVAPPLRCVGSRLPSPDLKTVVRFKCECGAEHAYPVDGPLCGA